MHVDTCKDLYYNITIYRDWFIHQGGINTLGRKEGTAGVEGVEGRSSSTCSNREMKKLGRWCGGIKS